MGMITQAQAVLARSLYLIHSVVTVYYTIHVMEEPVYYALCGLTSLILVEAIYTVRKRGGTESRWYSSSTSVFLISTVPCIWLLEIHRRDNEGTNERMRNESMFRAYNSNNSDAMGNDSDLAVVLLPVVDGWFVLPQETTLQAIKQSFLIVVILVRWILPLGTINRNQLSLLLFVYFATASDIMELFQLFDDSRVSENEMVSYCILGIWTLSLTQFILVLTMTRSVRKARPARQYSFSRSSKHGFTPKNDGQLSCCKLAFLSSDVWSLLVTLFMMDGPFLGLRMYIAIGLGVTEFNIIFFLIKNILVVALTIYRLAIIFAAAYSATKEGEKPKPRHETSPKQGLGVSKGDTKL